MKSNIFIAAALGAVVLLACGNALAKGASADIPPVASAAASEPDAKQVEKQRAAFMASLHPRTGAVPVAEAGATLQLGDKYYFLDKEDTRKVLVDQWGNPPSAADGVLGMVIPAGRTPFNDWGAVVTFEKTDYVADNDAATANYDSYITQIQKGEADDNAQRKKDGYSAVHLVGWAQPPSYNKLHHYLIWARDLKFADATVDTLNYDIRILGRRGVLSLNMVATVPELASIRGQAEQLATAGTYDSGARYEDYKTGDAKAAYGLAGLVAAGLGLAVAKKLGLLGLILVFGKKALVFILAGFAAIGRWFSTRFGKKKPAQSVLPIDNMDAAPAEPPATQAVADQPPTVEKP